MEDCRGRSEGRGEGFACGPEPLDEGGPLGEQRSLLARARYALRVESLAHLNAEEPPPDCRIVNSHSRDGRLVVSVEGE